LSSSTQNAIETFSHTWRETRAMALSSNYLTSSRVTWVIHCGGSQGLEAATILQSLHKFLNLRTLIRNYKSCEHVDTISGLSVWPVFSLMTLISSPLSGRYAKLLQRSFGDDCNKIIHTGLPGTSAQDPSLPSLDSLDLRGMGRLQMRN
jgi:hypothetical protein